MKKRNLREMLMSEGANTTYRMLDQLMGNSSWDVATKQSYGILTEKQLEVLWNIRADMLNTLGNTIRTNDIFKGDK